MFSKNVTVASILISLGAVVATVACSSSDNDATDVNGTNGTSSGANCSGDCTGASGGNVSSGGAVGTSGTSGTGAIGGSSGTSGNPACTDCTCTNSCNPDDPANNGKKDGTETDIDCGGADRPKCAEGKACAADSDCDVVCSDSKVCVSIPSCKAHFGGDTCGIGEVGDANAKHESCCRSLPVAGYTDAAHPGKQVYLDKYEITAGRIRSWIAQMAAANGGKPDVRGWIQKNRPQIWDPAWDEFLPTDTEGGTKVIARRLLGDPRVEDQNDSGPGVVGPPATDQPRNMGTNYQFGSETYVDLHGMDCATFKDSYGFPTYYYPPEILSRNNQVSRADGKDAQTNGKPIAAQEALDVKAMNCITNLMLQAFCAWDGGQLATDEVLDYVTATPPSLGNTSGCGTQYDNHDKLLFLTDGKQGTTAPEDFTGTVQDGGRCAKVSLINATFDAGDNLPKPASILNVHNYFYPFFGDANTSDKSWEVSAPGRATFANYDFSFRGKQVDMVRINPNDEPWMDLAGNLSEAALDTTNGAFSGDFALKMRGIGYGSARSDLNVKVQPKGPKPGDVVETKIRIKRPEAKAAYIGGRCMRFK